MTPSQRYNLPILGTIETDIRFVLTDYDHDSPLDRFEILTTVRAGQDQQAFFACNQWNDGEVQLVPAAAVFGISWTDAASAGVRAEIEAQCPNLGRVPDQALARKGRQRD